MARTKRSRARHEATNRIYGKKNPGLCVHCGTYAQHLYPKQDGSGLHICFPCKQENK